MHPYEISQTSLTFKMNCDYPRKASEASTRLSADNYLDYTFHSLSNQITNDQYKDQKKAEEYISDLVNTWKLNMNLIENLLQDNYSHLSFQELIEIIHRISDRFQKKKEFRERIIKKKSKVLIEKQIREEAKKKIEDNKEYYQEQMKEMEENRDNKVEYIKIFEKRLKEVEVYIQKRNNKLNSNFLQFKDFKINEFTELNTNFTRKREELKKELKEILRNKQKVEEENAKYQVEITNFSLSEGQTESENEGRMKLRRYYEICKNQIRLMQMKYQKLQKHLNQIKEKSEYFNFEAIKRKLSIAKKKSEEESVPLRKQEYDGEINLNVKDYLENEVPQKIATFMDFSVILNGKKCQDESNSIDLEHSKTKSENLENQIWDVSCIEKDNN